MKPKTGLRRAAAPIEGGTIDMAHGPTVHDKLRDHLARGDLANFSDERAAGLDPAITAEEIRSLLLDPDAAPFGVLVSGARIVGPLNLADACLSGGRPLGPLVLRECLFEEPIDLSNARLLRLDLAGSKLREIQGRGCRIAGPLDLSCVGSIEDDLRWTAAKTGIEAASDWRDHHGAGARGGARTPQGRCKVYLRNAEVGGELILSGAHFVDAPPAKPPLEGRDVSQFALDLSNARLGANVLMLQADGDVPCADGRSAHFAALGGVSIANAQIAGDLWAYGAVLHNEEGDALRAQKATIRGVVALRAFRPSGSDQPLHFVARGRVHFLVAEVGHLYVQGARLFRAKRKPDSPITQWAFDADQLKVHGTTLLGSSILKDGTPASEIHGGLNLANATIDSDLILCELRITDRPTLDGQPVAVEAHNLTIGDDLKIERCTFHGALLLHGARVRGDFMLREDTRCDNLGYVSLGATNVTVGDDLSIERSRFDGVVELHGVRVRGDLRLLGNRVQVFKDMRRPQEVRAGVEARNIEIGQDLHIYGEVGATYDFVSCVAGGDIRLEDITFVQDALSVYQGDRLERLQAMRFSNGAVKGALKTVRDHRKKDKAAVDTALRDDAASSFDAARLFDTEIYPGWRVVEVLSSNAADEPMVRLALWREKTNRILWLDGTVSPVHRMNLEIRPLLSTPEEAADYVEFFCAAVWGEETHAPFTILRATPHGGAPEGVVHDRVVVEPDDKDWLTSTVIQFKDKAVHIHFRIKPNGVVRKDRPDQDLENRPAPARYEAGGLRLPLAGERTVGGVPLGEWFDAPCFADPSRWRALSPDELNTLAGANAHQLSRDRRRDRADKSGKVAFQPLVDLQGLKVEALDDRRGSGWGGNVMLGLDGFRYDAILTPPGRARPVRGSAPTKLEDDEEQFQHASAQSSPEFEELLEDPYSVASRVSHDHSWRLRRKWLRKQYIKGRPSPLTYRTHPYQQLAAVYRRQGADGNARGVTAHRLRYETRITGQQMPRLLGWPYMFIQLWFGVLFRYGLSTKRALIVLAVCIAIGWAGAVVANTNNALVATEEAARSSAQLSTSGDAPAPGDACERVAELYAYAFDTFMPFSVGEASRCTMQPKSWRLAEQIYKVFGWLVTSLTALTITGVLRRWSGG